MKPLDVANILGEAETFRETEFLLFAAGITAQATIYGLTDGYLSRPRSHAGLQPLECQKVAREYDRCYKLGSEARKLRVTA